MSPILPQSESQGGSLGLNPKSEFGGSEEHRLRCNVLADAKSHSPTSLDAQRQIVNFSQPSAGPWGPGRRGLKSFEPRDSSLTGMECGGEWAELQGCPGLSMAIVAEQLTPRNRTADANYGTLVSSCNYEASMTIKIGNYAHGLALVITLPRLLCSGVWKRKTLNSRHQENTQLRDSLVLLALKCPRCLTNMQTLSLT